MSGPMAFRGTYADWKLVKTRGVVQVILEIPLADSDAAYAVLGGMPNPAQENWFAVAPLAAPAIAKQITKEPRDWRDVQPAAQAGIRCNDARFRDYLAVEYGEETSTPEEAAAALRRISKVNSRAEFSTNQKARMFWHQMDGAYRAWANL